MNQQRKSLIPKTLTYALASVAFTIPAAWLAVYGACIVYAGAPLCAWPGLYPLTAVLATLAVVAPIGVVYGERARRRASKGMWQRANGPGWGRTFERVVHVVWGSEEEPPGLITGEMRYEKRRWAISIQTGQTVFVDRREFWLWLQRVETLAAKVEPGQSPVSGRYWKPKIGEPLWLAYCQILRCVGAFEFRTDDTRSRRYVGGSCWSRVEEYEKIQPSEVY